MSYAQKMLKVIAKVHSYVYYASDAHLDYSDWALDWGNHHPMVTLTVDSHWTFLEWIPVERLLRRRQKNIN